MRLLFVGAIGAAALAGGAAAGCTTDSDCQLNGACTDGACVCDSPWTGDACGQLDLDDGSIAYGVGSPLSPNTSAWGGGPPVFDGTQYHLLVSEIAYGCGMGSWSHFSQAAHAVSDTLEGPYRRKDTAVGTWTHNTLYAYSPTDDTHLLYSIGNGQNPPSCEPPIPCSEGRTPGAQGLRPPSPWPANVTCSPAHTTSVHYSKSLDGPWVLGDVDFVGSPDSPLDPTKSAFGYSNPAPLVLDNGTVLMVTRGKDAVRDHSGLHHLHNLWMWRADSWNSSYHLLHLDGVAGAVNIGDGSCPTEDPVMYKGRRGYHIILHSHPQLTHAWSLDALHWDWSPNMTGPLPSASGNDHERPRVVTSKDGDVTALFMSHIVSNSTTDEAALMVFKPRHE